MGRNKKVKKPLITGDIDSDAGSEVNEEPVEVTEVHAEEPAPAIEAEDDSGKKEKKLSKKALQRMEQQKRAAEAPAPKKGKGRKKRGDTSSDSDAEEVPMPEHVEDSDSESSSDDGEEEGPETYPLKVIYCPNCTFPIEMCEFSGMFEKCKPFLIELLGEEAVANAVDKGRKRKIATEAEKLEAMLAKDGKNKLEKHVVMEVKSRGNGRFITYVRGTDLFGINMKDLCKDLKKAFATGAGVASEPGKLDAIEIQGDFVDQIAEILMKRFAINKDAIYKQEGKSTFPLFGERPQKGDDDKKKVKKGAGKMAMDQQMPDFDSGDRVVKSKIVVAEKREKVVKEEPEPRGRLFGPKVSASRGGGAGTGRGGCFNCGHLCCSRYSPQVSMFHA